MSELWIGTHSEADIIRATVDGAQGDPFDRRKWNVDGSLPATTPEEFWKWLVLSLLSSQQPYRKGSALYKLENDEIEFPVPLPNWPA